MREGRLDLYQTVIDKKATGNRIRQLREQRGLKVSDISTYMDFDSTQAVYKWQRGENLPGVENLLALSKLFGMAMEDILVVKGEAENASPFDS